MSNKKQLLILVFLMSSCMSVINAGTITTEAWTDDVSSQVSGSKYYTHIVDFGNNTSSPSYDGVDFVEIDGPSGNGFSMVSDGGFGGVGGQTSNLADNFSKQLVEDMIYPYNGNTVLTLYNLTPGAQYRLTLYSMGWEDGTRQSRIYGDDIDVPSSDDAEYLVNQDEFGGKNGQLTHYDYEAPSSGILNLTVEVTAGGGWHYYAFSNEAITGIITEPWSLNSETSLSVDTYFTHKVDLGNNGQAASYNGVTFDAAGNAQADNNVLVGDNYTITKLDGTGFMGAAGVSEAMEEGFARDIVSDFLYGSSFDYELTGLVAGEQYRFTLYCRGWGGQGRTSKIYANDTLSENALVFDQNAEGDGNGMLVHYDYVADENGTFTLHVESVGGDWHHYGFSNEAIGGNSSEREPQYTDVLVDNFDNSDMSNPRNLNYDLEARQSGSAATISYKRNTIYHSVEDGVLNLTNGRVSLSESFVGGPLEIQYEITSIGDVAGEWTGLRFGCSDELSWITDGGAIGLLLRNNGGYQLFGYDGSTTSGIYADGGTEKDMNEITGTLKIQITDLFDSKPFNGSGLLQAKFYWTENGTFGDPFAIYMNNDVSNDNVITFIDLNTNTGSLIDNLVVRMEEVPSGDIDGDYIVNFNDLATMIGQWLTGEADIVTGTTVLSSLDGSIMPTSADSVSWDFSIETDGSDVVWTSTGDSLPIDYSRYSYLYDMQSIEGFDGSEWQNLNLFSNLSREANPTKGGLPFVMDEAELNTTLPVKGSYEISFKFIPSTDWISFSCCLSDANRDAWVASNANFGVLFRTDGKADAWHEGTGLTGDYYSEFSNTNLSDTICSAKVVISDSIDNNPFDGVGETKIDVYAEDKEVLESTSPVITYTEPSGGFTSNYIQFCAGNKGVVSDINIDFIPYDPNNTGGLNDVESVIVDTFDASENPDVSDINYNIETRQTGSLAPLAYETVVGASPYFGMDPNAYDNPLIDEGDCFAFDSQARVASVKEIKFGYTINADIWSYINQSGSASIEMSNINSLSSTPYSKIRINGKIDAKPSVDGWSVLRPSDPNYAGGELTVESDMIKWDINPENNSIISNSVVYVPEEAIDLSRYEKIIVSLEFDDNNTDIYALSMSLYNDYSEPYMFAASDDDYLGSSSELMTLDNSGLNEWVVDLDKINHGDLSSTGAIVFRAGTYIREPGQVVANHTTESAIVKITGLTLVDDQCDCQENLESDITSDCIVNLLDFVKIADNWLLDIQ